MSKNNRHLQNKQKSYKKVENVTDEHQKTSIWDDTESEL